MEQLVWKNKLAALWTFQILNYAAVLLMTNATVVANTAGSSSAGPNTNAAAGIAFYFFLTCSLIWITLVQKPSVSRWPSMVVGVFFAFVKGYWLVTSLTGTFPKGMLFTEIWGFVAAVSIVWYGWKYPKTDGLQNN